MFCCHAGSFCGRCRFQLLELGDWAGGADTSAPQIRLGVGISVGWQGEVSHQQDVVWNYGNDPKWRDKVIKESLHKHMTIICMIYRCLGSTSLRSKLNFHIGVSQKKSTTNILDFVFSIYDPMLPYRRLFQSNTKSCLKGSRST